MQLDKVACRTALTVAQILYAYAVVVERGEEHLCLVLHLLFCLVAYLAHLGGILLEETFFKKFLVELLAVGLVKLPEYVLTELLYLSDDVPVLVVVNVLAYVVHYPSKQLVLLAKLIDKLVHSVAFYLIVVKLDAQVGSKVELASKIAQHALKERVDGFDAEVAVVVNNVFKGYTGTLGHKFFGNVEVGFNLVDITLRVGQKFPYTI